MKEFFKNKVLVIITSIFSVLILTLSIVGGVTISNLNKEINNLNNQIEEMNQTDADLSSYIDELETKLNIVETNLNATNTKIEELETAFGEELDEAEESILNDLNSLKTSLETEIEDINILIDGLTSKDSALEARITSLETSVDNLNTTLNALIIQVNQNKEDIEELKLIISTLETRIYCLEDNHQKLNIRYTYQGNYLLAEEYCIHCDDVVDEEYAYYNDVDGTYYYNFTNEKFEAQSVLAYEYIETENTYLIFNGASLNDLISGANDGATFKLMNDIEVLNIGNSGDELHYSIYLNNKSISLDLNGCILECQNNISIRLDNSNLTIIDSSDSQSGKITGANTGIDNIFSTLTINGGTIEAVNHGIVSSSHPNDSKFAAVTYINGGTIDCDGYDLSGNGTVYLGVNSETYVGATFLNGLTIDEETIINFVDTHIEYYDAVGNLKTLEDAANTTTIIKLVYHDENHDHLCDCGCGKVSSKCLDEDYDCYCDYCDETLDYNYNETTNTYLITNGDVINEVIALAEVTGTSESPATIKLLNDLEGTINSDYEVEFSYLGNISTGNIVLDLNGYTIDGGDAKYVFIIGEIEIDSLYYLPEVTSCDASFTIIDSSDAQSGKIIGKEVGIKNHGQSLTIDGGTIEISCTEASIASAIESRVGTLTINGGNFIVSSVSLNLPPKGIYVRDDCVLYMYGGNLTVTNTGGSSYGISLDSVGYIYGGTIDCETCDIIDGTSTVYLGVNEKTGVGATFVDGLTIWSFMTIEFIDDSITYHDEEGNVLTLEEASTVTTIIMSSDNDAYGRN